MESTSSQKASVREHVWSRLDRHKAAELGSRGYIPNFAGADLAADRLTRLPFWKSSGVIKTVPDRAQLPVRIRALEAGKLVYMASPRLAELPPFYFLDPKNPSANGQQIAEREVAERIAPRIDLNEMSSLDMVVCGSVAVNHSGARLGKGAGYSDIEMALLAEANLINESTVIVTTVHDLQIVDEQLAEEDHDFRVDYIVTPTRVIQCNHPRRPHGISWKSLTAEQISSIPALKRLEAPRDAPADEDAPTDR